MASPNADILLSIKVYLFDAGLSSPEVVGGREETQRAAFRSGEDGSVGDLLERLQALRQRGGVDHGARMRGLDDLAVADEDQHVVGRAALEEQVAGLEGAGVGQRLGPGGALLVRRGARDAAEAALTGRPRRGARKEIWPKSRWTEMPPGNSTRRPLVERDAR